MIKALFRKQLAELSYLMFGKLRKLNKKTGLTKRSSGMTVLYIFLFVYLFGFFGYLIYNLSDDFLEVLVTLKMEWLLFAFMGSMATALGIIGSVFMTQSMIYNAKDNDTLLSMPVPAWAVLFTRLASLYIQTFLFESLILFPTIISYLINGEFTVLSFINNIIILLLLPLIGLAITCILGFIVAAISSRIKNKTLITMVLFVAFMGGYLYVCSQINSVLAKILENVTEIGDVYIKIYPLYQMGLAATGEILPMIIFLSMSLLFCFIVFFILEKSFLVIATRKRGSAKIKYVEKEMKVASSSSALLRKEYTKFTKSPVYMLNSSMSSIFFIVGIIAMIIKYQDLSNFMSEIKSEYVEYIPLVLCAMFGYLVSFNLLTSCSISLEGKSIWVLQSLPVTTWDILLSKIKLHFYITEVPAVIALFVLSYIAKLSPLHTVLALAFSTVFTVFCAVFGLLLNLKFPNLNWSNETIAVKQSASVMISMFGSGAIVFALGGLYFAVKSFLTPIVYILICIALMSIITYILLVKLKVSGCKKFRSL